MEMPDGEVLAKASGSTEAYRDAGVGRSVSRTRKLPRRESG